MGYDAYLEDLRKLNEQVAANRAKADQSEDTATSAFTVVNVR